MCRPLSPMRGRSHITLASVAVLLLALTAGISGFSGGMPGGGPALAAGHEPGGYTGSLAISVHPGGGSGPVCFTLTDPAGRRMSAGPPCGGAELGEIPDAYQDYESIDDDETGAPGPVTRVIYIRGPMPGEYSLAVSLPRDDSYDIEAQEVDSSGEVLHGLIRDVPAAPGKTDEYVITYPAQDAHQVLRKR